MIQFAKDNAKANYPFSVQRQNTENWNTSEGHKDKEIAIKRAEEFEKQYPLVPWRVLEHTGGPIN